MQWLSSNDHWVLVWCAAGLFLDGTAKVLPHGRARRWVQMLAHLSPAAVFSARNAMRVPDAPPPAAVAP
jgi:hypothetical protein